MNVRETYSRDIEQGTLHRQRQTDVSRPLNAARRRPSLPLRLSLPLYLRRPQEIHSHAAGAAAATAAEATMCRVQRISVSLNQGMNVSSALRFSHF